MSTRIDPPTAFWRELHERLEAFVGRRISDPDAAEDLAQDVLLRLHSNLDDVRNDDRLDAFAYRIARNAVIDYYRSRAGAKETPSAPDDLIARIEAESNGGEVHEYAGRESLARCVEPFVRQLPDRYREALTLTDLGELSQGQAAEVSGLSVSGMKSRVQRGRAQLHGMLTECCDIELDERRQIVGVRPTDRCPCS